ncbi:nitrilotriacetate monooxygenase, partial [Acinetobacter baumannii]
DELIAWIEAGAADGFVLGFHVQTQGLDDFVAHVLPVLARRGYHDGVLTGATLRDHLGLPRPTSRHAPALRQDAVA